MNNRTIFITSIDTTVTDAIVLVPNREIKNMINANNYTLIVACNVEATSNLPVKIQTASGNIDVLCKYGNTVIANMINKRTRYVVGYGNENTNYALGQFVIFNCNCLNARGTETTTTEEVTTNEG